MKTNHAIGHDAEQIAANYLKENGFKINELNWKTRFCEIGIVAEKNGAIYFVEVKARKNTNQGIGLEYITPKKLNQMAYAAEFWVSSNNWIGEYRLSAISIDNDKITFIENI